jgi:multidrug efflux pump subunit AcrA (membrane-fusion protein)
MKKVLMFMLVLVLVAGAWGVARQSSLNLFIGEKDKVTRGDISRPVTATGTVAAAARLEIKAEASGEVVEINKLPGEFIREGDVIMRLSQTEEQRNVKRAEADLKRAKANLKNAEIALEERKDSGLKIAQARIDGLKAQLYDAEQDLEKSTKLFDDGVEYPTAVRRDQTRVDQVKAQFDEATAMMTQAKLSISRAEQDVILMSAAVDSAEQILGDAQERLEKTEIIAKTDGMMTKLYVQVGEVIQGGKTTITGGTILATIADMSKIYVKTEVDEADIGMVLSLAEDEARPYLLRGLTTVDASISDTIPEDAGAQVKISVEAFHDDEEENRFIGRIERIFPEPETSSGIVTYPIDILVTSDNRNKLLIGMQADVEFTAQLVNDVLRVPFEAVKMEDELPGVYVPIKTPDGKDDWEFRRIKMGLGDGLYVEVINGVEEGQEVYTKLPPRFSRNDEEDE